MTERLLNHSICLKEYITEKEYKELIEFEEIISSKDKVNLKLELRYRLNSDNGLKNINEFLYYADEVLVGYLGISCFGGNIAEINGMTHPDWRRKGIFKKLCELAVNECSKRKFDEILLLADGKSNSGIEFIKAVGGEYEVSEYRMEVSNKNTSENEHFINLRKAENFDKREVGRQDSIFFHIDNSYMIELNDVSIGKINIEYKDDLAFISGFSVLPEFRGKGYGKAALKEALRLINENNINKVELDVSCKNITALNLYKSCGFEEKSVMNYYRYSR